jgi:hypothetical protein
LLDFKQAIKNKCPSTLVGFITEAPLSSKIYHDYCKSSGALKFPTQSEETLNPFQTKIDTELDALNSLLKFENCNKQEGHTNGCMTVSWHNSVCRQSKRKNKSGKFRVVVKNDFRQLYDDLHATSDLKHKWFNQFIEIVHAEIKLIMADKLERTSTDEGCTAPEAGNKEISNCRKVVKRHKLERTSTDEGCTAPEAGNKDISNHRKVDKVERTSTDEGCTALEAGNKDISNHRKVVKRHNALDSDSETETWDFKRHIVSLK